MRSRIALALLGILLLGKPLLSAFLLNVGCAWYARARLESDQSAEYMERATLVFRLAHKVNPRSQVVRWAVGRAWLELGESDRAVDALTPLWDLGARNPLLFADSVRAYDAAGERKRVIALDQMGTIGPYSHPISDVIAFNYLEMADPLVKLGDIDRAAPFLERALENRPDDLFALYLLMSLCQTSEECTRYRHRLVHLSVSAVDPRDERLLRYVADVVPRLLADDIWNVELTEQVVKSMVWKHPNDQAVEQVISGLIAQSPDQPEWPMLLGELCYRRQEWGKAREAFQLALEVDPEQVLAYLGAGEACRDEAKVGGACTLEEAVQWYALYHELAPKDLFGMKRSIEVFEQLGDPRASRYRARMYGATDDLKSVAMLLGVPMDTVELGENVIVNGDFDGNGAPEGWAWVEWSRQAMGEKWDPGAFEGGLDNWLSWDGATSGRMAALWISPTGGPDRARAGFWQGNRDTRDHSPSITLRPATLYLVAFFYRTEGLQDQEFGIWLSPDGATWRHDLFLPPTHGKWRRCIIVTGNRFKEPAMVMPLLRIWGSGRVWIDQVQVRAIEVSHRVQILTEETVLVTVK